VSDRLWSWERWRQALEALFAALDWRELGDLYFHDRGAERWQEMRGKVLDLGEEWARAALRRLQAGGRTLCVGAGVAELPALLAERCVRGRAVRAVNRSTRECEILGAGLARAGLAARLAGEPVDGAAAAAAGGYDHLACVSLFTDPGTWPQLSAVAYGRIAPVQLDVDAFARERAAARTFAQALFAGLQRPGWITTTAEEVAWFLDAAAQASAACDVDDELVATAVVGDPIGFVHCP
jgi:hypothetical protein